MLNSVLRENGTKYSGESIEGPKGGKQNKMVTVMTEETSGGVKRSCNARCHNAKKPKCKCICHGRYHGTERDNTLDQKLREVIKRSA